VKTELAPTTRSRSFFSPREAQVPRELKPRRTFQLSDIPRLAGYALLAFVGWLLFSTLFRPWVSSAATRAIIDAPSILITTPIDGTVTALHAQSGQSIVPGDTVAVVQNSTVSRDTLTTLLTRRLDLQSHANDLANSIQSDTRMLDYVNQQYQSYHSASLSQLQSARDSAQSQQDAASARVNEASTKYWRAVGLQRDGAVSAATVAAARAQLDAAQSQQDAIDQDAKRSGASISDAQKGVYLSGGDGNNLLPQLAQRRADLQSSIANSQQEATALGQQLSQLNQLIDQETHRVNQLSDYAIKAYAPGTTQAIVTPIGTQVTAGATLVRATDCSKAGVVAVFPARMATRLNKGSGLDVQVSHISQTLGAHVVQLLPKASDALQNGFNVPFPYAEDGSVYALAQWDNAVPQSVRQQVCTPGRTVMASLR
jgi:multidrug resistance efflux pump